MKKAGITLSLIVALYLDLALTLALAQEPTNDPSMTARVWLDINDAFEEKNFDRSLLLAAEALKIARQSDPMNVPVAEELVWQALTSLGGQGLSSSINNSIEGAVISPNNRWLVTKTRVFYHDPIAIHLWDLSAPDPAVTRIDLPQNTISSVTEIFITPDSHWLIISFGKTMVFDLTAPDPSKEVVEFGGSADYHRWLPVLWNLTTSNPANAALPLPGSTKVGPTSSDGRWLVTENEDDNLLLWDLTVDDPTHTAILLPHATSLNVSVISPDNHWLATGDNNDTVLLWDLTAKNPSLSSIPLPNSVVFPSMAFSPDSRWLITGNPNDIVLAWDLTAAKLSPLTLANTTTKEDFLSFFSRDYGWLVTADKTGNTLLWNLEATAPLTPSIVLDQSKPSIISPDGRWLETYRARDDHFGNDRFLWDLSHPRPLSTKIDLPYRVFAFSPNGQWMITDSDYDHARLWDLSLPNPFVNQGLLLSFSSRFCDSQPNPSACQSQRTNISISPNGHWLIAKGIDGLAYVWDLTTDNPATTLVALSDQSRPVYFAAISPDRQWLTTYTIDDLGGNTLQLLDLSAPTLSPKIIPLPDTLSAKSIQVISPNHHWLVTLDKEKHAILWNFTNTDFSTAFNILPTTQYPGVDSGYFFSLDNHWLVARDVSFGKLYLWDLTKPNPSGDPIVLPDDTTAPVVRLSPDNRWLFVGQSEGLFHLWDLNHITSQSDPIVLRQGEPDRYGTSITEAAFSPDGHWLATKSIISPIIRLWDLTSSPFTSTLHLLHYDSDFSPIVFSKDNRWLITAQSDEFRQYRDTLILWDLNAPNPLIAPTKLPRQTEIATVAISPNNRWVVSGDSQGNLRLWTREPEKLLAMACRTTGRNLSLYEWERSFSGQDYRRTCPNLPLGAGVGVEEDVND